MELWPQAAGPLFAELAVLLAVGLVISAAGFRRVYWFVSIGYAGSIAAMALVTAARHHEALSLVSAAPGALMLAYGARLGVFLLRRERSPDYRKELAEVEARNVHMRWPVKVAIWLGVSVLYVTMFAPALFVILAAPPTLAPSLGGGVVVMVLGLALEAWADAQKAAFKRQQPRRFCDRGLYAWVRCPNYLGEMIFWVGAFVAGGIGYGSLVHGAIAAAGLLCIQLVMLGSARRLELKQDGRYGADPDYVRYTTTVPVLLPFLPLYSLKRLRVYLG